MQLDRRKFLAGLFGTAAVAAAGVMPKALELMPELEFVKTATAMALPVVGNGVEIWGNDKGDYSFCDLGEGWRPLLAESNRIGEAALRQLYDAFR